MSNTTGAKSGKSVAEHYGIDLNSSQTVQRQRRLRRHGWVGAAEASQNLLLFIDPVLLYTDRLAVQK
ncbi:hypothetical protein AAVH_09526 [Aphelenchoides avenae]|nr:hypothetical protein AAVH_09526 [Aphelenchus avenae]